MSLIKSISGIRGTIGGKIGDGLNPIDIVKFVTAYAKWVRLNSTKKSNLIVVGRDARISGEMVYQIVSGTLVSMGFDVLNIGLASTPTTELAVVKENAEGGIILTASHNPKHWNALKLLNQNGEFLNALDGLYVLSEAMAEMFQFATVDQLGAIRNDFTYDQKHIDEVLSLSLIDLDAIRKASFKVVIDCVNSVGGLILPPFLKALGVKEVVELNCTPNGQFPHNPEPLPEHLTEIADRMRTEQAHVGFVVDPDVDRLAMVCEDGSMFGEEYTLVAVADYVLSRTPGNTVSNLSSTRALRDVTKLFGGTYTASAVGEVNVVETMKRTDAVIGGEGNGGVIYPPCHYGRDALVGIGLFLSHLAQTGMSVKALRQSYPAYYIDKQKIELTPDIDVDAILDAVKKHFKKEEINDVDGVKIDFPDKWVHLRKSNTEPIIRIYSEAPNVALAQELTAQIKHLIESMV